MVQRRLCVVPAVILLASLSLPAAAGALGMSDDYPREIVSVGTGQGVRLTRLEAKVVRVGPRVRVSVRLAGESTAGTRKLRVGVAPCSLAPTFRQNGERVPAVPSRPNCRTAASATATVTEAPFSLARAFTIPRPAMRPGALRVLVGATGSKPVPACTGYLDICGTQHTGELQLNGNTWTFEPGTWWGVTARSLPGVTLDRILFRSRMGGWVATSAAPANVLTTWGYENEPVAKSWKEALTAGVQQTMRRNSTFGGEFQARPTIKVLDHAASIDGRRLFTVRLPLPVWQPVHR